jgi:hypothetical protein
VVDSLALLQLQRADLLLDWEVLAIKAAALGGRRRGSQKQDRDSNK